MDVLLDRPRCRLVGGQLGIERVGDVPQRVAADEIGHLKWPEYDESFSRCSPGMLLLLESTRWAARRELHSVELLGVEAPWTRMWTEEVRPCVTVAVYPARPSGLAALAGDVLPPAAGRLSGRVRELRERWQPSRA
jgi:hypothetical protein